MTVGRLHTIATRAWTPPEGADRDSRLTELREVAGDRADLLAWAAGILLGIRVDDEHDPRHRVNTAGAEMLLEVAGVDEYDPAVQEAVSVGRERREQARKRPEPPRGW